MAAGCGCSTSPACQFCNHFYDQCSQVQHRGLYMYLWFDPTSQSEQLTSTSGSKRDAKVALQALDGAAEIGEQRWRAIGLAELAQLVS
jgi:hypothetical protein